MKPSCFQLDAWLLLRKKKVPEEKRPVAHYRLNLHINIAYYYKLLQVIERKNMVILWTSDLNTGIDVVDNQHKRIVDYINQLENAVKQQNPLSVGQVLDELVDYTLSHFAFEESPQEAAGYKFAKPHKAVHDVFVKRVAKYQERHRAGDDIAAQLYSMLATWLLHHIKRDDMAYVSEVRASLTSMVQDKKEEDWISRSLGRFFK